MTVVTFRDAAVLSYLTRHQHVGEAERQELAGTLTPKARRLVQKSSDGKTWVAKSKASASVRAKKQASKP